MGGPPKRSGAKKLGAKRLGATPLGGGAAAAATKKTSTVDWDNVDAAIAPEPAPAPGSTSGFASSDASQPSRGAAAKKEDGRPKFGQVGWPWKALLRLDHAVPR